MKIEVGKKDLLIGLKRVGWIAQSAVAKANPILENLLLEAKKDKLCIMATNMASTGMCKIACKVAQEGKVLINAQKFIALIETFGSTVMLNADDAKAELLENKTKILLPIANIEQYPVKLFEAPIDYKAEFVINGKELKTGLSSVMDFKKWDSYESIGGISFRTVDNVLKLCATDGNALAIYEIGIAQKPGIDFVMPPNFAENFLKTADADDVKMCVSDKNICIQFKTQGEEPISVVLKSALINCKYPLYDQFIPKYQDKFLTIEKEPLEKAIKKASILKDKVSADDVKRGKAKPAAYYFVFECGMLTKISFLNKMDNFIPAEYTGDPFRFGISPDYLLKALNGIKSSKVTLAASGELSPILFKEEKFTSLLMPIKIAN